MAFIQRHTDVNPTLYKRQMPAGGMLLILA